MDITKLREHRILLEPPFYNSYGNGIALFDLISTFIVAYLIEPDILPYLKITRLAYYLLLLPLGVIVHIIFKQDTFLNKQLNPYTSMNIYKIIMIVILYKLYKELV